MWKQLPIDKRKKYKAFITNFSSLSEAFSQKSSENEIVAPIINSKFQETVFQRAFDATGEDISNTSYDASIRIDDKHRYLIGIKSFGIKAGDQKIAQFKKDSVSKCWTDVVKQIQVNSEKANSKEQADLLNAELYLDLATKISESRNTRIESSKEQIRGFAGGSDADVEGVYHVLMPSTKEDKPKIFVGETSYLPIAIDDIKIEGSTNHAHPTNFTFTDGHHKYKYTSADSQLSMSFENKTIIQEDWDINYIVDPFTIFENLSEYSKNLSSSRNNEIEQTVSWILTNRKGEVERSSGFNGFDGASKLTRKNGNREKRIKSVIDKYNHDLTIDQQIKIKQFLEKILLDKWSSSEKETMKSLRTRLMNYINSLNNNEMINEVSKMVYRPTSEMYIPIPDARKFHDNNPDFFGASYGLFKGNSAKLLLPKDHRRFQLEFLASGDTITAYINQDNGKGIQSYKHQDILGNWILRGVFQLKEREILTAEKLDQLGINGIRMTKFKDKNRAIGLEFIWIDPNNPPDDAIGWISEKRKTHKL